MEETEGKYENNYTEGGGLGLRMRNNPCKQSLHDASCERLGGL